MPRTKAESTADAVEEQKKAVNTAMAAKTREIADYQSQIASASGKQDEYEKQLDELGRRMEQKTGQLKKYEDKIREQDEMIQTYANSTSWKITEPMRKIMRLLKK